MSVDENGLNFLPSNPIGSELSEEEKKLRKRFVEEYIYDRDKVAAAIRIGFPKIIALDYAEKFLDEPYVQLLIKEKETALEDSDKEEEARTKREIRAMILKEAKYYGPNSSHSARVAALSKLMSLYDMDAPTKVKGEFEHRGGVMMVPATASIDDWEQAAMSSQDELVNQTRTH